MGFRTRVLRVPPPLATALAAAALAWAAVAGTSGLPGRQALVHAGPAVRDLAGAWQGTLEVPGASLRVVFQIAGGKDGYRATLDSPDQGAKGIPVGAVALSGSVLRLEVPAIGGSFEGTWEPGADRIPGKWIQGGREFPLELRFTGEEAPAVRARQRPTRPFPYREVEVTYPGPGGHALAGTLTLPPGDGPFPAVLLLSGSGPQDRNESLLGHEPFFVLADDLTRRGIAVLRVDDRGVGKSTGDFSAATMRDFAHDAAAGLDFLRSRPEIRRDGVGLLGHSEGALVASMLAAEPRDVAFLVLLAGPGMPGERILLRQADLIAQALGASEEARAKQEAFQRRIHGVLKAGRDSAATAADLRAVLLEARAPADTLATRDSVALEAELSRSVRQLTSPWFRHFLTYDPRPALEKVRCPVLALGGERDLQVPAQENLDEITRALAHGGNSRVTARLVPGVNHLFQTAAKGTPDEYGQIEETMAPGVLRTIGDWIVAQTAAARAGADAGR